MEQNINQTPTNSPEGADLENRRELVQRLGKYAAYAAPFMLLAKANAASGVGSSGGPSNTPAARRK